jgi:hypothetical protein
MNEKGDFLCDEKCGKKQPKLDDDAMLNWRIKS